MKSFSLSKKIVLIFSFILLITSVPAAYIYKYLTEDILENLGNDLLIEHVEKYNEIIKLKVDKELALISKISNSQDIINWIKDEENLKLKEKAFEDLEIFRKLFEDESYFLAIKKSDNYYYNDNKSKFNTQKRYSLQKFNSQDAWFYKTLQSNKKYLLNVDYDEKLNVTKIWINYILKFENEPIAIIGTGFDLSKFVHSVLNSNLKGITNILIDLNGNIQAHKNYEMIDFRTISKNNSNHKNILEIFPNKNEKEEFKKLLSNLEHSSKNFLKMNYYENGNKVLLAISKLGNIGWYNVSIIRGNEIVKYEYFIYLISTFILSLIVLVIFLACGINKLVLKPVNELNKGIDKIINGEYDIRFKTQSNDEIGKFMGHFKEMSQKIKNYTQLLESSLQKANKVDILRKEFMANVSHELKTPLNSINLLSSVLSKNKKGNLDEEQLKSVKQINLSGKHLLNLVQDVLTFSELENGKTKVVNSNFNLKNILQELYETNIDLIGNKEISFSLSCDENIDYINSDKLKIKEIIQNLISNAFKFTTKGKIEIYCKNSEEFVEICVSDSGIGISQEQVENIFDRFYQIDGKINRKYNGTGIGLAICKELAFLIKGHMEVQSRLNEGSLFILKIPKDINKPQLSNNNLNKPQHVLIYNNDTLAMMLLIVKIKKQYTLKEYSNLDDLIENYKLLKYKVCIYQEKLSDDEIAIIVKNIKKEDLILFYDEKVKDIFEKNSFKTIKKPFDILN